MIEPSIDPISTAKPMACNLNANPGFQFHYVQTGLESKLRSITAIG